MLKVYGQQNELLKDVFNAVVLSHALYAANLWFRFCSKDLLVQLDRIIRRAIKCNYWNSKDGDIQSLVDRRGRCLFKQVIGNPDHTLHCLLTEERDTKYALRERKHNLRLPAIEYPHDTRNFII